MNASIGSGPSQREFARLFAEMLQLFDKGEEFDIERFANEHSQYAEHVRQLKPTLELLADEASFQTISSGADHRRPRVLGDYRLVREVGRGGMGVVYEAVQISLGKRVALKILPFAGVLDERSLRRFRNEARAAAQLPHPHIVQVHDIDCDRGVHYYVMQYVDGLNLAQIIKGMRQLASQAATAGSSERSTRAIQSDLDEDDSTIEFVSSIPLHGGEHAPQDTGSFFDQVSTKRSSSSPQYFAACARLGMQVAEALHYAHDAGVIHRDIKPSNLLVDRTGNVSIADFGLAQVSGDPGITLTGDVVGTLRYMSPEQALAKRVVIDHRTDIYSLGATLYELLTLVPVCDGKDREAVLRQIAFNDPIPLRRLNRRIPHELETIVLKALAKNPDDRYQTAEEMAQDLRCYQKDMPIKARRPTLLQRTTRWGRRHRAFVWSTALLACFVFIGSIATAGVIWNSLRQTDAALQSERQLKNRLERSLLRSEGLRLAAHSTLERDSNPGLALLLAIEAASRRSDLVTNQALLSALDAIHEERTLTSSTPLVGAQFSPDGTMAVTAPAAHSSGSPGGLVEIWDPQTGKRLRALERTEGVSSAVFSTDGARLLTSSARTADADELPPCLWDSITGRRLNAFRGATLRTAHRSAFDPTGQRIVLPHEDNVARIWDAIGGHSLQELKGHSAAITFAAFSPTGREIVTVSNDRTVRVWNPERGEELHRFEWPESRATRSDWHCTVAFHPTATKLATGTREHGAELWDLTTGNRLNVTRWPGSIVRFSPGGEQLLAYDRFGILEVRDTVDGRLVYSIRDAKGLTVVDISADGDYLLTSSENRSIRIWNAQTGQPMSELRGHDDIVHSAVFAPDNLRVLSASEDRTARVWNIESGADRARYRAKVSNAPRPLSIFSPDSQKLLVITEPTSSTNIWNLADNEPRATFAGQPGTPHFASSGQRRVTVDGQQVLLWNTETGMLADSLTTPVETFRFAKLSPDGENVVAVVENGPAWIWHPASQRKYQLSGHAGAVLSANFHPQKPSVITASSDGFARLFDLVTGEIQGELKHDGAVQDVLFNSTGDQILTVSSSGKAHLWKYPSLEQVLVIDGKLRNFLAAQFSFDSRYILTYGIINNLSISCWDASSGELVRQWVEHPGIARVAVSPSAPEIIVGSDTKGPVLWNYETNESTALWESPVTAVAFSSDGQAMAAAEATTRVAPEYIPLEGPAIAFGGTELRVWDRSDLSQPESVTVRSGEVRTLTFSHHTGVLVIETLNYGGAVFDTDGQDEPVRFTGHAAPISFAVFTPDAERIVTSSWDDKAIIWDTKTGQRLNDLVGHESMVLSCAISSDGETIATASADGTCRLWKASTGTLVHTLSGHTDQVWQVSFSSDDRRLLTISRDKSARVWDLNSRQSTMLEESEGLIAFAEFGPDTKLLSVPNDEFRPQRLEFGGPTAFMLERVAPADSAKVNYDVRIMTSIGAEPIRFPHPKPPRLGRLSPDGKHVLTVTDIGEALLWDAATGERIRSLAVAGSPIIAAAFSPDGKRVVTQHDEQWNLWNAATGARIVTMSDPSGFASSSNWVLEQPLYPFSPDGKWLLTISRQGVVRRWPLGLLATARENATRELTRDEKARFEIREVAAR